MKQYLLAAVATSMAGGLIGISTDSYYRWPDKRCDLMGPDLHPSGTAFNDPPTHIDD